MNFLNQMLCFRYNDKNANYSNDTALTFHFLNLMMRKNRMIEKWLNAESLIIP